VRRSDSRDNFDLLSSGGGSKLLRGLSSRRTELNNRVKFNPNIVCDLSKLEMLEGSLDHFTKQEKSKV
jgi:hypothetical protein